MVEELEPEVFIFDCFGVLLGFDEQILSARLKPHLTDTTHILDIHELVAAPDLITGQKSLEQVYTSLVKLFGLMLPYEAFVALWNEPYSWSLDGMPALLARLAQNHKLLLLSNIDSDYFRSIWPSHPEMDYFQEVLLSCDLGMAKPDLRIFHYACSVAGVNPSLCLFIDDTLKNVHAAQQAGLQAYWFRSLTDLREELVRRRIRGVFPEAKSGRFKSKGNAPS